MIQILHGRKPLGEAWKFSSKPVPENYTKLAGIPIMDVLGGLHSRKNHIP
jgi:hypothetical protein